VSVYEGMMTRVTCTFAGKFDDRLQPIPFEHFINYASAPAIEDYLDVYRAAGFRPLGESTRHDPGLRNGFLCFGPEYVEFCWVEDESRFATDDEESKLLRAATRPSCMGLGTPDSHALHNEWAARSYEPASIVSWPPQTRHGLSTRLVCIRDR
jgi:hypothetical protein